MRPDGNYLKKYFGDQIIEFDSLLCKLKLPLSL